MTPRRLFDSASTWIVANGARVWGFAVVVVLLAVSWETLRGIHMQEFRRVLHALDLRRVALAALITLANVTVMGCYDVLAFRHTRTRAFERWRHGAVAFCWSNFLTLGPLAGPAIRLWLYRGTVDDPSTLHAGIVSVAVAFVSGLAGWAAAAAIQARIGGGLTEMALLALLCVIAAAWIARAVARRIEDFAGPASGAGPTLVLALVGWTDWLLAAAAFMVCLSATGAPAPRPDLAVQFFFGQVIGLASLIPGGFGSSDAYWIARLPFDQNLNAAALTAYRFIYYIAPWFVASLVLLSWATRVSSRRADLARRVIGGLVGGAGALIILSSASPALHARLIVLERIVPLPLVEAGQMTAAVAGLLLLALARGLARGYSAAFKSAMVLLLLAGFASLLKGLDWEEAVTLMTVGVGAWSQAGLFRRPSEGDWLEWTDLGLGFAALLLFLAFGTFTHHLGAAALERWSTFGYQHQAARFLRTGASMTLALLAAALYVVVRTPVEFERPPEADIARALDANRAYGTGTTPMMVGVGDKSVFFDRDGKQERGFCLYRTIGPYLVVFSDPVVRVRTPAARTAFLDALFAHARDLDRRLVFYQISVDWIPQLHDFGYHLFKLGEEAHVPLDRVTLTGHAGKMHRQILRRAERDGLVFRVLPAEEVAIRLPELAAISDDWLRAKHVVERQFSIGYFDPAYMARFPCAVVQEAAGEQRILAFANVLEGPGRGELSVDLMRYRSGGPSVMDYLILSLLLLGKDQGYRSFNLGMAPLASVGEHRGAHPRERLAGLAFRRGENWYNFQGVRFYKQKFDPEWMPRYMAYQAAWEWPVALANVSALIAGSWGSALLPGGGDRSPSARDRLANAEC
jgi:phosphatidylglycerol lysyltransferase